MSDVKCPGIKCLEMKCPLQSSIMIISSYRVTPHVLAWLYSEQSETRNFSESLTLVMGERWTLNVWNN